MSEAAPDGVANELAASKLEDERPICCIFERKRQMFRITTAKGKALASGGFGVTISDTADEKQSELKDGVEASPNNEDESTSASSEYLFPEEVLFLHDRGLLECQLLDEKKGETVSINTSQLFQMLPQLGMSLAMYFVYAHLRSQEFRVTRHDPLRFELLQKQQELTTGDDIPRIEKADLKRQVRHSIATAVAPQMDNDKLTISWDVYNPNAKFAKTHPGTPNFYVAATFYSREASFLDVHELVKTKCHGVPLKLATVSDSGTVVMFGVTDFGIPCISNPHDAK